MNRETIIGCIIIFLALGIMTYLVIWANHMINKIGKSGPSSARKLTKEMNGRR